MENRNAMYVLESLYVLLRSTFIQSIFAIFRTDNEWDATEQQKHKLRLSELQLMAEIELKKRRLELEYEERQRAAEIFREQLRERAQNQREIVAHFAAFVSTGPRRELRQPR